MVGNTGPGDGSGADKIIRVNTNGELLDGRTATLQAEETTNDSDKTFTVTTGYEWEVLSVWVELGSDGTSGNRQVTVEFQDSASDVIGQVRAGAVQAASLTRYYLFAPGQADLTSFRDTDFLMTPLPKGFTLPAGYKIRVFDKAAVAAATDDMVVQMMVRQRALP